MNSQQYLQALTDPTNIETFQEAWKDFLFNINRVRSLDAIVDDSSADAILKAGTVWNGGGWNTTTASRALYDITEIALVSKDFKQYSGTWLYGLALHWKIDIDQMDLTETAAAAAFQVASACDENFTENEDEDMDVLDEKGGQMPVFDWEMAMEKLPKELQTIWDRYGHQGHRLEVKNILSNVPCYEGMPVKPPENNHQADYKSKLDRSLKATQSTLLHILRTIAAEFGCAAVRAREGKDANEIRGGSFQEKAFALGAALYFRLQTERKENSIPGSTPVEDGLFSKDDIAQAGLKVKINQGAGKGKGKFRTYDPGPYSFRAFRITGRFQRPRWGKGKGRSTSSYKGQGGQWKGQGGQWTGQGGQWKGGQGGRSTGKGTRSTDRACSAMRITPQVEAETAVVEASRGEPGGPEPHYKWCATPVAFAPIALDTTSDVQVRPGCMPRNFRRLQNVWSGKRSFRHGHKVLRAVVHNPKDRLYRKRKATSYFRLSPSQRISRDTTLQVRRITTNFANPEERDVGHKSGPHQRLFSLSAGRTYEKISPTFSRGQGVRISSRTLRAVNPTPTIHGAYESTFKKMEGPRSSGLGIPGRHFTRQQHPSHLDKAQKNSFDGPQRRGVSHKSRQVPVNPSPRGTTPRILVEFQRRTGTGTGRKTKIFEQRTRKISDQIEHVLPKGCGYSGTPPQLPTRPSLFKGVHRRITRVQQPAHHPRLGHPPSSTPLTQKTGFRGERPDSIHQGPKFREKMHRQSLSLRRIEHRLGGAGHRNGGSRTGILEAGPHPTHKCERNKSGDRDHQKFSAQRRTCPFTRGQHSRLRLFKKVGGAGQIPERNNAPLPEMVPGKQGNLGSDPGKVRKLLSGRTKPHPIRQRGLHPTKKLLLGITGNFCTIYKGGNRHVREPREPPARQICEPTPPLGGLGEGRSNYGLEPRKNLLGEPTMDHNRRMAGAPKKKSTRQVPHFSTPVGWCTLVAPTSKALRDFSSPGKGTSQVGAFPKLPGGVHAAYTVAPPLCSALRTALAGKQVSIENIEKYIRNLGSLSRYDRAFRILWAFCKTKNKDPLLMSLEDIAMEIMNLNKHTSAEARHAYSALLLLPQFGGLRFLPQLRECKRDWNTHQAKYSEFWSAQPIWHALQTAPLCWSSAQQVRDRLILVLRLVHLFRSIDLHRSLRVTAAQPQSPSRTQAQNESPHGRKDQRHASRYTCYVSALRGETPPQLPPPTGIRHSVLTGPGHATRSIRTMQPRGKGVCIWRCVAKAKDIYTGKRF